MKQNGFLFIGFIIALIFLLSCKSLLYKKYSMNRPFNFQSPAEYLKYLHSIKGLDTSHVIHPDSSSIWPFMQYIQNQRLSEYYGTLINDSVEIKKSKEMEENLSCIGRALTDIERNVVKTADTSLYVKNDFYKYKFFRSNTNVLFDFNESTKPVKIFLIYSYNYGTYYDIFFKKMNEFAMLHQHEVEVYIISLDYAFHFM